MDEFLAAYYGGGWQNIKAYITAFDDLVRELGTHATIYAKTEQLVPFDDERTQAFLRRARMFRPSARSYSAFIANTSRTYIGAVCC